MATEVSVYSAALVEGVRGVLRSKGEELASVSMTSSR
jgi:hypothetical protein